MNRSRAVSWGLLAVVLAAALLLGSRRDGSPPTDAERADRIAASIRCPTCRSQSMADSDSPAARAGRDEILRQVKEGRTDAEIRAYFVDRYSTDILLDPPKRGLSGVVWVLPVLAVAGAVTALVTAFRRWRPRRRTATAGDRALVDEALRS